MRFIPTLFLFISAHSLIGCGDKEKEKDQDPQNSTGGGTKGSENNATERESPESIAVKTVQCYEGKDKLQAELKKQQSQIADIDAQIAAIKAEIANCEAKKKKGKPNAPVNQSVNPDNDPYKKLRTFTKSAIDREFVDELLKLRNEIDSVRTKLWAVPNIESPESKKISAELAKLTELEEKAIAALKSKGGKNELISDMIASVKEEVDKDADKAEKLEDLESLQHKLLGRWTPLKSSPKNLRPDNNKSEKDHKEKKKELFSEFADLVMAAFGTNGNRELRAELASHPVIQLPLKERIDLIRNWLKTKSAGYTSEELKNITYFETQWVDQARKQNIDV